MRLIHFFKWGIVLLCLIAVAGCGGFRKKKDDTEPVNEALVDYKSARSIPRLEMPPGLGGAAGGAVLAPDSKKAAKSYASFQATRNTTGGAPEVLPTVQNAHIERAGTQRWLVVEAEPKQVWNKVRDFWLSSGMVLVVENPATGVMETDWATNYANVGNLYQKTMRKWLGSIYSAGRRDKFRVRLERGEKPGTTEIFLTHRGMEEKVTQGGRDDSFSNTETVWAPTPADPGLEAEMLRLLMVHVGVGEKRATQITEGSKAAPERARLSRGDSGQPVLTVDDNFSRAWRRVGITLDRIGFTVEDRDRSKGVYFVRYSPNAEAPNKKRGFLSRMFRGDDKKTAKRYQIKLDASGTQTQVSVANQDEAAAKEDLKTSERILSLLHDQLK